MKCTSNYQSSKFKKRTAYLKEWEWYFRTTEIMKQTGKKTSCAWLFCLLQLLSYFFSSFYCQMYKQGSTCYLHFLSASPSTTLFNRAFNIPMAIPRWMEAILFRKLPMTPFTKYNRYSRLFYTASCCGPAPPAWNPLVSCLLRSAPTWLSTRLLRHTKGRMRKHWLGEQIRWFFCFWFLIFYHNDHISSPYLAK